MRATVTSLLALLLFVGCDSPKPTGGASSAAPSTTARVGASASAAVTAAPPAAEAEDLDVAALQKALKCANDAGAGPCGVLAGFGGCKAWNPVVPSGDGRWIGRGHLVSDGKTTEQLTLLRSRRVPTAEVGGGQLPVKIGLAELPKTDKTMFDQGERALRAYERQDVPPKNNAALDHIKQLSDWADSSALRTKGGQVMFLADGDGFICQGAKQQLLMVKRLKGGGPGDGLYAQLWATTW
jgi:hypothetical protein